MDIEFIEYHDRLRVGIIQIPLYCLPSGRLFRSQRRITLFGEIHPHALYCVIESVIIRSSGEESVLRIIEYCREFCGMSRKEIRNRGLNPEKVMVSPAACSSMVF